MKTVSELKIGDKVSFGGASVTGTLQSIDGRKFSCFSSRGTNFYFLASLHYLVAGSKKEHDALMDELIRTGKSGERPVVIRG